MRAVVTMGPAGTAGLDELSVRGTLRARVLVRADGSVGGVEIVVSSGDPALDEAARRGLLRWRFLPARRNGQPIDAYVLLWVMFRD